MSRRRAPTEGWSGDVRRRAAPFSGRPCSRTSGAARGFCTNVEGLGRFCIIGSCCGITSCEKGCPHLWGTVCCRSRFFRRKRFSDNELRGLQNYFWARATIGNRQIGDGQTVRRGAKCVGHQGPEFPILAEQAATIVGQRNLGVPIWRLRGRIHAEMRSRGDEQRLGEPRKTPRTRKGDGRNGFHAEREGMTVGQRNLGFPVSR